MLLKGFGCSLPPKASYLPPWPPCPTALLNVLQIGCGDQKNLCHSLNLLNLSEVSTCIRLMIRRQLREPFSVKAIATQETPTETTRFLTGHHRKDLHNLTTPGCWVLPARFRYSSWAHDALSFPVLAAWEGLQPPSVVDMWLGHGEEFTSRKSGGKTRFKTALKNKKRKIHPYNICMYVSKTYVHHRSQDTLFLRPALAAAVLEPSAYYCDLGQRLPVAYSKLVFSSRSLLASGWPHGTSWRVT